MKSKIKIIALVLIITGFSFLLEAESVNCGSNYFHLESYIESERSSPMTCIRCEEVKEFKSVLRGGSWKVYMYIDRDYDNIIREYEVQDTSSYYKTTSRGKLEELIGRFHKDCRGN